MNSLKVKILALICLILPGLCVRPMLANEAVPPNHSELKTYTISGTVAGSRGALIASAIVSFSDPAKASASPVITASTEASGRYSIAVPPGTWQVAASSGTHNTSSGRIVSVRNANVSGIHITLKECSTIRGKVTRRSDGAALADAIVSFSRAPDASGAPALTVKTDASGNYAIPAQDGTWFVAARGDGYYTSADKKITITVMDLSAINFSLTSKTRNIPRTADLLFSAVTDSLPASGAAGDWPSHLPADRPLTSLGSPMVETISGAKWINHSYADADGFRLGTYSSPIAVNGVSIVVAVKPKRNKTDTSWTSIVDLFYNRVVIGIRNSSGKIDVWINRKLYTSDTAIPSDRVTILSLVIQPNGRLKAYANGVQKLSTTESSSMLSLNPNGPEKFTNAINIGRNNPDGWSAFNGHIGDVFVYKVALTDTERRQLEADLAAKFQSTD